MCVIMYVSRLHCSQRPRKSGNTISKNKLLSMNRQLKTKFSTECDNAQYVKIFFATMIEKARSDQRVEIAKALQAHLNEIRV